MGRMRASPGRRGRVKRSFKRVEDGVGRSGASWTIKDERDDGRSRRQQNPRDLDLR